MNNKLLIVIDMQNDFVTGSLANPMAEAIIPSIIKEMDESAFVFFTRDTHYEDYLHTSEGKKLPIEHCIIDTDGWQIIDALSFHTEDRHIPHIFLNKRTFAFDDWKRWIMADNYDEIEIVGVCTDICVVSNALVIKSLFPEKKVCVKASACAGTTKEMHEAALKVMESCQIDIVE